MPKIIETVPQYILEHFLDHIVPSLSWMSDVDTHVEGLYMYRTPPDYHTEELFLELCRDRWERYNMPTEVSKCITKTARN